MNKSTKKSKSIDEILDRSTLNGSSGLSKEQLRQEIQDLIDEAVEKETKQLQEMNSQLAYFSIIGGRTQKLIDEAVEKERKRILDRDRLSRIIKTAKCLYEKYHRGHKNYSIFIADALIKELGGENE